MFGIDAREVAAAAVLVAIAIGGVLLPPPYGTVLQYLGLALLVILAVRLVLARRRRP